MNLNNCQLGFTRYRANWFPNLTAYFTERELAHPSKHGYDAANQKRLVSRLLCKFLFLESRVQPTSSFRQVESYDLFKYSMNTYLTVELMTRPKGNKYFSLVHHGKETNQGLSISYGPAGTIACCTSPSQAVSLDLEEVATREASFYRQNFTNHEREWVYENVGKQYSEDQLFTFLRTLK